MAKLDQEVADTLVRRLIMPDEILEMSPLYRKWVGESREEGVAVGLREAITAVLQGRFGALPAEVEQALASADRATLESLLPDMATGSLAQLRARSGV